jgi:hypothetical protein
MNKMKQTIFQVLTLSVILTQTGSSLASSSQFDFDTSKYIRQIVQFCTSNFSHWCTNNFIHFSNVYLKLMAPNQANVSIEKRILRVLRLHKLIGKKFSQKKTNGNDRVGKLIQLVKRIKLYYLG